MNAFGKHNGILTTTGGEKSIDASTTDAKLSLFMASLLFARALEISEDDTSPVLVFSEQSLWMNTAVDFYHKEGNFPEYQIFENKIRVS